MVSAEPINPAAPVTSIFKIHSLRIIID